MWGTLRLYADDGEGGATGKLIAGAFRSSRACMDRHQRLHHVTLALHAAASPTHRKPSKDGCTQDHAGLSSMLAANYMHNVEAVVIQDLGHEVQLVIEKYQSVFSVNSHKILHFRKKKHAENTNTIYRYIIYR